MKTFELPDGWRSASGIMTGLVAKTDWSATPLGDTANWSASLKLTLDLVLNSAFPMALRWGPEFVLIYNDAYLPILGDKHPWALGRPASEAWSEVWGEIAPIHTAILSGETSAIYADDLLFRIQRKPGLWEDARFTLGYTPVADVIAPTGIGGILVTCVETTLRFAAEAALRLSEERYELALGAAGAVGTWDWNVVTNTVIANPTCAGMFSVDSAKALAGVPLDNFVASIHPDDKNRVLEEIESSVRAKGSFASEYRLLKRDGTVAWVYARGRAKSDASGSIIRLPGAVVDITERKHAEEALSESRSFLHDILRSAGEAFYAVDREGATLLCNQAFLDLMGFASEADVIGRKLHDIIHHTRPDGSHYDKADCPIYQCAANGLMAHVDTEFFYPVNGAPIPVEYRVNPIFRGGKHCGAICVFIDISERKAAAAALLELNANLEQRVAEQAAERDRLWQTSQDLLTVVDIDGIIRAVNPAWTSVLGWDLEEVVGKHHVSFSHADYRPSSDEALVQALNGPLLNYENRMLHKDGSERWIAWSASADSGKVYAAGRDITAEKAAEEALAKAEEALRQSQKVEAIGQLTGGVAHDFNNLLTVIIGSVEMLRRPNVSEERKQRHIDAISDTAYRASKLTGQLLAFARRQSLKPEVFDTGASVEAMHDMIRSLTGSRITVSIEVPEQPCFVNADRSQFDTAVINMAVNARDAMNASGRLTISVRRVAGIPALRTHTAVAGNFAAITIADTGVGIAADHLDQIFEPFFTTKEVGEGTGLGLSQVFGFAKQTGGDIQVTSDAGNGATFTMFLPIAAQSDSTSETVSEGAAPALGQGARVLVVEDNAEVGEFAAEALSELGYRAHLAVNGMEALGELAKDPQGFDIVFSDVVMPGMTGIELGQQIRKLYPRLPVILTSGYSIVLAQNGAHGFELLQKPYSIEQLSGVLQKVTRSGNQR